MGLPIAVIFIAMGRLAPTPEAVDYGLIHEKDGEQTVTVWFVNKDSVNNRIVRVRTTCGCTVANYDDKEIAPGDSAWIEVTYNPNGRMGKFEKAVRVTDEYKEVVTLPVKGVIKARPETIEMMYPIHLGPLYVTADQIVMKDMKPGESKHAFINVYNDSEETLTPEVVSDTAAVEVISKGSPLEAGDVNAIGLYVRGKELSEGANKLTVRLYPYGTTDTLSYPIDLYVNITQ